MNEQIIPTLTESIVYSGSGGVTSVNGYTGDVVLDAEDVGAASTTDLAAKADKNNGTLTGTTVAENITISGDLTVDSVDVETSITVPNPSDNNDATNKSYVDTGLAAKANAANATLTGTAHAENIIVDGDLTVDSVDVLESITVPTPSDNNDAANKSYVDTQVATKVSDVQVNGTSVTSSGVANVTTVDNVTSASSLEPLAAKQGKLLNDRINNLENIGRFLALWNSATGLPLTNPTTMPYAYKTGDYYRVSNIGDGYSHALAMSGTTTSVGTYSGDYTLNFTIKTQSNTQLTTAAEVIAAMDGTTRYTASGTLTTTDTTYTIASVLKWLDGSTYYIAICDDTEQKLALISASTTQTDTVTGGLTNYKPTGSSYDGTASSVTESETVEIGSIYYYDGTSWNLQASGGGGTVQDVQVNGTSILSGGVANLPLYTSTGTNTDGPMTQNAVTSMVFQGGNVRKIAIGDSTYVSVATNINNGLAIGTAAANGPNSIAIGSPAANASEKALANGNYSLAIGNQTHSNGQYSVALGHLSKATAKGEVSFGGTNLGTNGYNSSQYRLLTNLYDPQSDHDAANKQFVVSYAALNGAGAPTTATVAKYVGQLYYDTTNSAMYYCSAIDTTTPAYTWISFGGSGGDTVYSTVQTSNYATGGAVYIGARNASNQVLPDPSTTDNHRQYFWALPWDTNGAGAAANVAPSDQSINIGGWQKSYNSYCTTIGYRTRVDGDGNTVLGWQAGTQSYSSSYGTFIGNSAQGQNKNYASAFGYGAQANEKATVALGAYSTASVQGEVSFGGTNLGTNGYNSTQYRLLTNVYDGQSAHDAVNKQQLDGAIISGGTTAPTTATVGKVGTLYACVESGTGKLYICTAADDTTSTYTWSALI